MKPQSTIEFKKVRLEMLKEAHARYTRDHSQDELERCLVKHLRAIGAPGIDGEFNQVECGCLTAQHHLSLPFQVEEAQDSPARGVSGAHKEHA